VSSQLNSFFHAFPPRTLLSFIYPFLPHQTAAILDALQPLLSLLTSPTRLVYTAYTQPTALLSVLKDTYDRLGGTIHHLDMSSTNAVLQTALPFLMAAAGVYVAMLSLTRSVRSVGRVLMGVVKWSWLIGIVVTVLSYMLGNGGNGNNVGGPTAGVIGSLVSMALGRAGGGAGAGDQDWTSLISTIFGTSNDATTNNNNRRRPSAYSTSSKSKQSKQSKDRSAQSWESLKKDGSKSTRSRKPAAAAAAGGGGEPRNDPLSDLWSTIAGRAADGDAGGLGGYAQKWVKDALFRVSGLDGVLGGGGGARTTTEEDNKRRRGGR
jgi:hypothetical protein